MNLLMFLNVTQGPTGPLFKKKKRNSYLLKCREKVHRLSLRQELITVLVPRASNSNIILKIYF